MEWYTIEYLYPSAFKDFRNVMFPNVGLLSISSLETFDLKKLYGFFDKRGVYLNVEMYSPYQWVFNVSLKNGIVYGPSQETKETREEIEIDGFMECFRILEKIMVQV